MTTQEKSRGAAPRAGRLVPLIKIFGGKGMLFDKILPRLTDHRTYIEPYIGGGSVFLNKATAALSVINDLDPEIANLWAVVQGRATFPAFYRAILAVDYSEDTWHAAIGGTLAPTGDTPVDRAVRRYVRHRQSRGGLGNAWGWSDRQRRGMPEYLSAWATALSQLPKVHGRLQGVVVRNDDALDVIRENEGPGSLTYADPPYLARTRTAKRVYDHEMDEEGHVNLLNALGRCRGAAILSGYRSELYDSTLAGWSRVNLPVKNHSGQGRIKQDRVECLWIKPATR